MEKKWLLFGKKKCKLNQVKRKLFSKLFVCFFFSQKETIFTLINWDIQGIEAKYIQMAWSKADQYFDKF